MHILLIKGMSQYDVLDGFVDAVACGFEKNGAEIEVLDVKKDNQIKRSQYDLIFAFNGVATTIFKYFPIANDTPVWSFLVDHPYYLNDRIVTKAKNHFVSCVDLNHVDYIEKLYPNIVTPCFVPHGGETYKGSYIPYDDREYEVIFMGTLKSEKAYFDTVSKMPMDVQNLIYQILEDAECKEDFLLEDLITPRLKSLRNEDLRSIIAELSFIDTIIRSRNRKKIIDKLIEHDIKVHIFGNGWEEYSKKYSDKVIVHESVSYNEMLNLNMNSKIVLNNMPLFRNGSHERVFTAMLNGAVCVTEESKYLKTQFVDDEDLVFFRMDDLDSMCSRIKEILNDSSKAISIVESGKERALNSHTWENRAKSILDFFEENCKTVKK